MTELLTEWGMRQEASSTESLTEAPSWLPFYHALSRQIAHYAVQPEGILLYVSSLNPPPGELPVILSVKDQYSRERKREAKKIAGLFASRAKELAIEAEVWVSYAPDFLVTAVLPEFDLDAELALQAVFVDLIRETDDPGAGDLIIRLPLELEREDLVLGERIA